MQLSPSLDELLYTGVIESIILAQIFAGFPYNILSIHGDQTYVLHLFFMSWGSGIILKYEFLEANNFVKYLYTDSSLPDTFQIIPLWKGF